MESMDQFSLTSGRSNSRSRSSELQGPRPPPLKVHKDSHKIKKPPVAPQPQQPPRPPVIIYTVSPKIIHTNPNDFMNLVQRLTGLTSSSSSSSAFSRNPLDENNSGAMSPAARYATIEKARTITEEEKKKQISGEVNIMEGIDQRGNGMEWKAGFPGILSPGPALLPPIPSNFFSPQSDTNTSSFFHDLSPIFHGNNRNFIEGNSNFMPSPSNYVVSPSIDFFNNIYGFQ